MNTQRTLVCLELIHRVSHFTVCSGFTECAESELLYRDVDAEGRVTERRGAMQVWSRSDMGERVVKVQGRERAVKCGKTQEETKILKKEFKMDLEIEAGGHERGTGTAAKL
ncbi:hypothetical protein KUCAC02_035172 [Chaenocephalus aceratus]|nr:hypothetical protein KUCAC02_035172 [Chaenocephalus aceratus]